MITQAVLLAAGLGTRLRPLSHQIPKPAMPVGGIPLLFYNLALLKIYGVKHVVINLHHLPHRILHFFQKSNLGLEISFSKEKKLLGTGGGIKKAASFLKPDPFFVLNGDVLSDISLRDLEETFKKTKAIACLAVLNPKGIPVSSFVEYSNLVHRISGLPPENSKKLKKGVFSGASLLDPKLFSYFPFNKAGCLVKDMLVPALVDGKKIAPYEHPGFWCDLGNLESLKQTDQKLWRREVPSSILEIKEIAEQFMRKVH